MLRINRSRVIGLACLVLFIYYLVFSDSASTTDFRSNTEAGLARKHNSILRGDLSDEELTEQTNRKLEGILAGEKNPAAVPVNPEAKHNSPTREDLAAEGITREKSRYGNQQKAKDTPDEIPIAGRRTMPKPKTKDNTVDTPKYSKGESSQESLKGEEVSEAHDPGKDKAREKLSEYLKNPIVIFSKTYCPHSRRAKELLLDIYNITPAPLVVELDQLTDELPHRAGEHSGATMGATLQGLLKEVTGRGTVPNIIVGGSHSIGGNDLIWNMHDNGLLGAEIQKYGGKRITSLDLKDDQTSRGGAEGHGLKT